MSFTETTRTSWFSRLKNGLAGILLGPILVFGMIWLLSWNEGRSVQTYRSLVEGAGMVVSVDSNAIDPANEGKLVHITGVVTPDGIPEDTAFGIAADGAAGLERSVEMYQWIEETRSETRKTLGGGEETVTNYDYVKDWRDERIDSSDFRVADGHDNPDMPFKDERFTVASATLGAFTVDGAATADLGKDTPIKTTPDMVEQVAAALGDGRPVKADAVTIFVSQDRQKPAIGDLRVRFVRQDVTDASFIGAQRGSTIADYTTSNGRTLMLSAAGQQTAGQMFDSAQSDNTVITWIVRLLGMIGIFVGFVMMMSILGILADVIPFVGSIVSFGTSAIALVLTMIVGPLVIAIAWIAYRPLVAIAVLAAGAALAAGIVYLRRKTGQTSPAAARA